MNELTIVAPKDIAESEHLSSTLAKSSLLSDAYRGKPADILSAILTGAELGLAPMQSLRSIVVIKGRPTLSADAMVSLCKRRADICTYLQLKESTPTKATYETQRKGDPSPTQMSFSIEDAQRAGLAGNDNYKKFPAQMLRARCASAICRAVYPDLVLGLYDPEELSPDSFSATPPPVQAAPVEKDITPKPTATVTEKVKAMISNQPNGAWAVVKKIKEAVSAAGFSEFDGSEFVRSIIGPKTAKEITEADYKAVLAALEPPRESVDQDIAVAAQ